MNYISVCTQFYNRTVHCQKWFPLSLRTWTAPFDLLGHVDEGFYLRGAVLTPALPELFPF